MRLWLPLSLVKHKGRIGWSGTRMQGDLSDVVWSWQSWTAGAQKFETELWFISGGYVSLWDRKHSQPQVDYQESTMQLLVEFLREPGKAALIWQKNNYWSDLERRKTLSSSSLHLIVFCLDFYWCNITVMGMFHPTGTQNFALSVQSPCLSITDQTQSISLIARRQSINY